MGSENIDTTGKDQTTNLNSEEIVITEYCARYEKESRVLLYQLQEHLVNIDDEHVQIHTANYGEAYLSFLLRNIQNHHGTIMLAIKKPNVIGLVAGWIEEKDEEDYLTNRCPKRGLITELVVAPSMRSRGVGKTLITQMEKRFAEQDCEFVAVDVFAPNKEAIRFYESSGYRPRNIELYKRIQR